MSHPSDAPTASTATGLRARRVVIADDTADIRLMLHIAMTQRADVELVGEARDGQEAIDLVAALRPDLLVLDIDMPVLDGLSALPRIREVAPDTRVVMLTAISNSEYRERAHAAGAVAYVEKTTSIRVLVDELLRATDLLGTLLGTLTPSVHEGVAGDARTPTEARLFVTDTLASWGEDDLADVVELLVSELVTNVVVHTEVAPRVSVRLGRDIVHVEVFDADPTMPAPRTPDRHATSGRGIPLVEMLSLDWGTTPVSGGKVVWFDVARTSRS